MVDSQPLPLSLLFQKFGISLGLGLLVGLQREKAHPGLAGIRTFALITVLGTVSALLSEEYGGWLVAVAALGLTLLLVIGNLGERGRTQAEPGLTTEIAALLMFGVGAYLVRGPVSVCIALGGTTALLLYFKQPMHTFVARMGPTDLRAIMQFVLIALVIWPILPDEVYGPYQVLNPHNIWLMVVLIVALSLGAYVAYKILGAQKGILLAGILGGMISSTAVTVSVSRLSREKAVGVRTAALVLLLASSMAYGRVLTEIALVAGGEFWQLAPPLLVVLGWSALLSAAFYFLVRREEAELPPQENPAELKSALIFAGLYSLVILGVGAAQTSLGERGLYLVATLSGLHDLDAITLSTARFVDHGQVSVALGWRLMLIASQANFVMKTLIVAFLGDRALLSWVLLVFGAVVAGGVVVFYCWP